MVRKYLLFICILICSACQIGNSSLDCIKTNAALDLGSGTTKISVAKVNVCKKKIEEILFQERVPIAFMANLVSTQKKNELKFSDEIMKYALKQLESLKNRADVYRPEKYTVIATSAFRQSSNGIEFAERIKQDLGITVSIILQKKEAEIGLKSASVQMSIRPESLLVWDIGGGSTQMMTYDDGEMIFFGEELGSVSFKELIINKVKKKKLNESRSPNPFLLSEFKDAEDLAQLRAAKVSEKMKNIIKSKKKKVLGIGGVHNFSIYDRNSLQDGYYTYDQIKDISLKSVGLSDDEIGGEYAATDISNLAFVMGYMKGLSIEKVYVLQVDLIDALLVYPEIVYHE